MILATDFPARRAGLCATLPPEESAAGFLPLLGDLNQVPLGYRREVADTKRVLERWVSDNRFRDAFLTSPRAALDSLDVKLTRDQLWPFVDTAAALELNDAIAAGETGGFPTSVTRYRAFIREKIRHRQAHRKENRPHHTRMANWWSRQVYRLAGQVGPFKADRIVHAPVAFELTRGCSVHCWFCALRAEQLEAVWPYTPDNARQWRETLDLLGRVVGPAVRNGFCYWATEPLDNPDYEHFLEDFQAVLGGCPQTTTAKASADIERTRRIIRLSYALGGNIDRFSILSLSMLDKIHNGFSADELLRVELLPQNRGADDKHKKANVGRATDHADKRAGELTAAVTASTTACVSGFLLNMVDRSVQLITPCPASERWPLGYWVVDQAEFASTQELADVVDRMIEEHMPSDLGLQDRVRLRPDISITRSADDELRLVSLLTLPVPDQPKPDHLMELLLAGTYRAADLAEARYEQAGVPHERTLLLLQELFDKGMLDEEPAERVI